MAKIIKMTPECVDEIRKEFEAALSDAKLADGKITFSKSFNSINREATVYFTNMAWEKMQDLVREFDKEVAWHGLAYRGTEAGKDEYFITDILVYPQEVTGSTVNTDQGKYQTWLMEHDDDVFNNIRMQGHSHVNMGVTPSGVDNSLYERILEQLDDSMFYIFLIYNKKGDKTYKIYDMAKNVLFETADVKVVILDDDEEQTVVQMDGLSEEEEKELTEYLAELRLKKKLVTFTEDAKQMVRDKVYTPPQYGSGYAGRYGYGGYAGRENDSSYFPGYTNYRPPAQTTPSKPATQPSSQTAVKKKTRKGKRKNKNHSAKSGSVAAYGDDEDYGWTYPYSPINYSTDGFPQ